MSKRIPITEFSALDPSKAAEPQGVPMAQERHVNLEVTPEPADARSSGSDKPGDKQDHRPYTLRISEVSLQDIASNLMFQRWVYRVVIGVALLNLVADLLGFDPRPVEYVTVQQCETKRDQLRQQ